MSSEPVTNNRARRSDRDFIFGRVIGEGSFSVVYLAKDIHTSKECASKYNYSNTENIEKNIVSCMSAKYLSVMLNAFFLLIRTFVRMNYFGKKYFFLLFQ